jgi:hypothetical protein
MIQASELRLGNLIWARLSSGNTVNVTVHTEIIQEILNGAPYEPIPLTEEILEKCWFKKVKDYGTAYWKLTINNSEAISIEDDFSIGLNAPNELSTQGYASYPNICSSVHQLQNLFFALTGTELKINP